MTDKSPDEESLELEPEFSFPLPVLADLPQPLYTICYDYGSPFSYGPIGQELVWTFPSRELAEAAIPDALEQEPDSGVLHAAEVSREELADRFPAALFFDAQESVWLHPLQDPPSDDTPLPDEPYALFVEGGGIDRYLEEPREGSWAVHRDEEEELDYVLFFEDLDTAEQILTDFIEATEQHAEVRRTRADTLTDGQGVRYYHASGHIEDLPRHEYLRRCR
ncbi:hypothetical protein [Armatimonas sp.]|uniref:hypothetical protein n=1 Tax=Armatimonas sp. TaxID=1872638 RepID=UPI003750AC55